MEQYQAADLGYELPESLDAYRARITRERQLRAEAWDRAQRKRGMNVLVVLFCGGILAIVAAVALVWPTP